MTARPVDPVDGELHVHGPNVYRWQDGVWLLQEPLGLPSRPNLAVLRNEWVGRWALIVHPTDGVASGFVDRFVMVDGDVVVVLHDGTTVTLDRHSTMAHDPHGRDRSAAAALNEYGQQVEAWAANLLRSRAVIVRDRGDIETAHELDGCAARIDRSAVPVTATEFQGVLGGA